MRCFLNYISVDCRSKEVLIPGAVMEYKCAKFYVSQAAGIQNGELNCGASNEWIGLSNFMQFKCKIGE